MTPSLRYHYVIIFIGTPINVLSDHFEAKMAMCSITQNVGYSGLLEEVSSNTSSVNSQTLAKADDKRKRRSQENMNETKSKRLQKVYGQKQYQAEKSKGLTKYRGKKLDNDENKAPSETFLCSQTKNLGLKK